MLLTITTTHKPATELGYLLHRNPSRLHSFPLSFGQAYVFYPEASTERCTAALLLDVDPVGLVRSRTGPAASFAKSLCVGFMSVCSACWRWKARDPAINGMIIEQPPATEAVEKVLC